METQRAYALCLAAHPCWLLVTTRSPVYDGLRRFTTGHGGADGSDSSGILAGSPSWSVVSWSASELLISGRFDSAPAHTSVSPVQGAEEVVGGREASVSSYASF